MSRYPLVALGEVLAPALDPVPVKPDATYQTAGIYSFGRGLFARPPITGIETKYKTLFRIRQDQFIYSRLFAWEGALAIVPPDFDDLYVSQEFPTFDVDLDRAEPRYLAWLCRWKPLWEALQAGIKGLGLRRQRVHPNQLLTIQIPLPPIEEQHRLAQRIDFIVSRAQTAKRLRLTAGDSSTRLIGSILGQLDRSASKVRLGEIVSLAMDEVPVELDKTYSVVGIYSFGRGLFARPPITGADTKYKILYRLHKDQLVLSRLNGWEGALAIVPPHFDGMLVSHEYPTFNTDPEQTGPQYLNWLCHWPQFWDLLVPRGSMVRRKRVHPDRLLAVQIPLPPLKEQRRLARIARTVDELDEVTRSFDVAFEALEPSIIGAAIEGRL